MKTALKKPSILRLFLWAALGLGVVSFGLTLTVSAADLATWPSQYKVAPWDTAKLTDADVVGPDGIVYPNFTGVGVTGGIPDINNTTIRAGYTVYDVTAYGAAGDGVSDDDAAVAAALADARANAVGGVSKSILYFPAGTYLLTDPLTITENNLVVDGDGPASTVLKLQPGSTSTLGLITIQKPIVYIGYIYPTSNILRGSNTATFDKDPAANGYSVGTWVRMMTTQAGAGKTMSDRYSNPANNVVYDNAQSHFGRVFIAKVTAINSATKTMTFDRSFVHDYYTDEVPEMRTNPMVEFSGAQDLTIETTASAVTLSPLQFDRAANCWIKNVTVNKADNWPMNLNYIARFEVRDSVFNGSWTDINGGSQVYLGWIASSDSVMDNCQANDMRHMPIFQTANRCVVRNSTFTGTTVQSPQLHGRMPLDNLIETSTFTTRGYGSTAVAPSGRGISAYASDGAATLRHGIEGPRNVFYNNNTTTGAGFVHLQGISENLIFAYNRVLKTDDIEALPSITAMDRTFDTIIRGNIFQSMIYTPFISLEDPTCTGWSVTDNQIYGSNGYLWEGDSDIATAANNRFFPAATTPPTATTPEVASIYDWQRANATTARLVLVIDNRTVTDTGGTTTASVVRVKSSTAAALTVNLSTDIAGISVPATVTIPAGQARATFTITGGGVSGGEKTVTLTAAATGLLSDIEKIQVLDQNVTQPNFGGGKMVATTTGLPANWKARNNGQVTVAGSQSYTAGTDTWSITGAGLTTNSYDGALYRSGRKFVYATVDGDGEIRARLTTTTGESQVGLMIADDEATGTDHIWVEPNGRVVSNGDAFDTHGKPTHQTTAGTKTVPIWLRLKRVGTTFSAYQSTLATPTTPTVETEWTLLYTKDFYNYGTIGTGNADYLSRAVLDSRMHFGMFINSGSLTTTATATFTGVAITGTIVGTTPPPAAPTAFSATLSGTTANLAWTDNSSDETGFLIEYQIGSGAWNTLATTAANATAYAHTSLLDGRSYNYRLKAVRSTDSTASSAITAGVSLPATSAPLAPTALSVTPATPTSLTLSWTDNAYNESGYEIWRSTTSGSGFTQLATLGADASSYTDSGLPEGSRYYYSVRATNGIGNSAYTPEGTASTPLVAPTSILITNASAASISLAWTDNTNAETGYVLERRAGEGAYATLATLSANTTSYTDTNLVVGTSYTYRLRATNAVTSSADSAAVGAIAITISNAQFYEPFNFDTAVSSSILGQPGSGRGASGNWLRIAGNVPCDALQTSSLTGTGIVGTGGITTLGRHIRLGEKSADSRIALVLGSDALDLVTPPANGVRTFWVSYLCRTPATLSGTYTPGLSLDTVTNSPVISLQSWTGNTSRRYSLAGTDLAAVNSANSTVAANTTYLYVAKITVTDTDGNAANGLEKIAATLWQYPSGTTPPATEPTTGGISLPTTTVSSRAIQRIELRGANSAANTQFFFDELRLASSYVRAVLTNPSEPLGQPQDLKPTLPASGGIRLTWTDNAGAETGYIVQRRTGSAGSWSTLATVTNGSNSYTDTTPAAQTEYYYRVAATDGTTTDFWSQEVAQLTAGTYSDPASLAFTQPASRTTAFPVTLFNRSSLTQTFSLTAASGGTNYSVRTSSQPGGPAFVWNDIATTGTKIAAFETTSTTDHDDEQATGIPIGFSFPIYGTSATQVSASTNGLLWFDGAVNGTAYGNVSLPGGVIADNIPAPLIAVLWDDLSFTYAAGSHAYYKQVDADTFVIQFTNVTLYSDAAARATLQVHLKRSGDILLYYKDCFINTHNYTIGIQNAARTVATQVAYNSEYVTPSLAVRLRPPAAWLTTDTASLTLDPGTAGQFNAQLNSTGLATGTFASFIQVTSDQARQPSFDVPVTLTVSASANPPLAPTGLAASGSSGNVTLTWTDSSSNETGFELQRSSDQATWTTLATTAANATSGSDAASLVGTFYYRVRARGSSDSAWSPTASIVLHSISGTITQNGTALAGVTVSDGTRSATTAADGTYTITGVPVGSYTLTPSRTAYVFTPASLDVSVTASNVTRKDFTSLTTVQSWSSTYGLPSNGSGTGALTADPDGDGMVNLLEYALGGNPTAASSTPLPSLVVAGHDLSFTFARTRSDMTYIIEASTDLVTWSTLATNPGTVGGNITVTDTGAMSTNARRFLRLRVSQP